MKKVKNTASPTVRQMTSMSQNLQEKFKRFSDIQLSCTTYHDKSHDAEYSLYVENIYCRNFKSWKELLSFYHQAMKSKFKNPSIKRMNTENI